MSNTDTSVTAINRAESLLKESPYQGYTYSYPHKTAYRVFDQPVALSDLWATEKQSSLFLYLHVPFCEHRCGFCNLFTQANPEAGLTQRYLRQISDEASLVRRSLDSNATFGQLAIGGGTPTFLSARELETLLKICQTMGADGTSIPVSVEVSPATVDDEKLSMLAEFETDRVSIGIQSFDEAEAHRLGRPQKRHDVEFALSEIRRHRFPILNIDLIYGGEGQSTEQWMKCVQEALRWKPEELYLYPLYVRPLTGLGRLERSWDDQRLEAYRAAREFLLASEYEQVSMRMFRRLKTDQGESSHQSCRDQESAATGIQRAGVASDSKPDPQYRCQSDGMIGLGCGARSYTASLHYSTEFAVGRQGVRSILMDYLNRPVDSFSMARYGFRLSIEEQRRRFLILGLLQTSGLKRSEYRGRFGCEVLEHFPELAALNEAGLIETKDETICLTEPGLERSDAIGPWLYSEPVQSLMKDFDLQ